MLHILNKTNTTMHDLFLYFKICHVKKKIRSVSKEDTNQLLILKKFRSASNEDTDPFFIWKKSRSASKEDADPF